MLAIILTASVFIFWCSASTMVSMSKSSTNSQAWKKANSPSSLPAIHESKNSVDAMALQLQSRIEERVLWMNNYVQAFSTWQLIIISATSCLLHCDTNDNHVSCQDSTWLCCDALWPCSRMSMSERAIAWDGGLGRSCIGWLVRAV